jgi:hypothetical protein
MDEVRRSIEHLCLHSSTAIAVDMTQPMAEEDRTLDPFECQCFRHRLFRFSSFQAQTPDHARIPTEDDESHLDWRQCQQSQRQAQQSTLVSKIPFPSFQHCNTYIVLYVLDMHMSTSEISIGIYVNTNGPQQGKAGACAAQSSRARVLPKFASDTQ